MRRHLRLAPLLVLTSCAPVTPEPSAPPPTITPIAAPDLTAQLSALATDQHEDALAMFHLIGEAAARRDPTLQPWLKIHRSTLAPIPEVAAKAYDYQMGDPQGLADLLADFDQHGLGRDTVVLLAFGYVDEWDETLTRFRRQNAVATGAAGELVDQAIATRKRLYGTARFEEAWARTP